MIEFLQIALSLPTVLFTTLLGTVLGYWILVILGALDIEGLGGSAEGAADGVLEGAADGVLEGAADGVLEGAADGVLEGAADGVLEGAADGVVEGAADGVVEGAADGAVEGSAEGSIEGAGAVAGLLAFLRVGKVPVTVVLSVLVLWSWLFTFMGSFGILRGGFGGILFALAAAVVGVAGLGLAVPATSFTVRPLERLFERETTRVEGTLVGRTCRIRSLRVDRTFGMGEYDDGAAGLLLQVRCPRDNDLSKGSEALIVGYDRKSGFYQVEPLPRVGQGLAERGAEPVRGVPVERRERDDSATS